MNLYKLPPGGDPPHIVNAVIEIPRGGHHKYEYDPELELFTLDRVLYSAVHYPADYGFIPGTVAEDGDPVDILVITGEPSFTGCLIEARPVGLFRMRDEKGDDEKILSVPVADPHHNEIRQLSQVRPHFLREVEHFFHIYKELEGKTVETLGWEDREAAFTVIQKSIEAAIKLGEHKNR
ncbi:MAG: inorganic diphosphatase [Deltaproteobacteria bacterium]|jgi:inorganic pyrophosphatase